MFLALVSRTRAARRVNRSAATSFPSLSVSCAPVGPVANEEIG